MDINKLRIETANELFKQADNESSSEDLLKLIEQACTVLESGLRHAAITINRDSHSEIRIQDRI